MKRFFGLLTAVAVIWLSANTANASTIGISLNAGNGFFVSSGSGSASATPINDFWQITLADAANFILAIDVSTQTNAVSSLNLDLCDIGDLTCSTPLASTAGSVSGSFLLASLTYGLLPPGSFYTVHLTGTTTQIMELQPFGGRSRSCARRPSPVRIRVGGTRFCRAQGPQVPRRTPTPSSERCLRGAELAAGGAQANRGPLIRSIQ